jgi:leader peptidase (prepilin peptidase) / N-methyltransferase
MVAGGASAVFAAALGPQSVLVLYVALAVLGTGLGAIDIACRRLPTVIVAPAIAAGVVSLLVLVGFTGAWGSFGRAILGAVALGLVFQLLYLVPGGNLGYGDVRLAVLLGLFLGWLGWREVIWGALLPWLVNGPVALTLLMRGRVGRKSRLPFGPALLVGALLSVALVAALPG